MRPVDLFKTLKRIWESWDMRSFLLLSFSIQCMLILMATMRKRTSRRLFHGLIWLAYLLADWAAYYALGLINENDNYSKLHAFWAPFFLLHLGGPTTITGYAVEDNELWTRSVLHLLVQASMTGFIIYQSIPQNQLLLPTLLMFYTAIVRYTERILALQNASTDEFRSSAMNDYGGELDHLPPERSSTPERLTEVEMVKHAYCLFQRYKRIFGGLPIKFDPKLEETKRYLVARDPNDAFTEMEIQLNLTYSIFYTKMWLIMEKMEGTVLSATSLTAELVALGIWVVVGKERYQKLDVDFTNTLLLGALVVDAVHAFKLLFSDLMIPRLKKVTWIGNSSVVNYFLNKVLSVRHYKCGRRLFGRWSGSISQFNLMEFIKKDGHTHRKKQNAVTKLIQNMIGPGKQKVNQVELSDEMRKKIFERLKQMANYATDQGKAEDFFSKIGAYTKESIGWKQLNDILSRAGLVEALLLWHLATELFYKGKNEEGSSRDQRKGKGKGKDKGNIDKQLSEYMMYLLVRQPMMIAEGIGFELMFVQTCEHLKKIYEGKNVTITETNVDRELEQVRKAKGDSTMRRSMLSYAHYIADYLKNKFDTTLATDIIRDVWVDLLCHVAIKCNERAHLNQLRNGGELLTLVWLMMTNLGLTTNYEPQSDVDSTEITREEGTI